MYTRQAEYEKTNAKDPPPQITKGEQATAVKTLNSNASPGNDGISIALILECYVEIADALLSLYNKC